MVTEEDSSMIEGEWKSGQCAVLPASRPPLAPSARPVSSLPCVYTYLIRYIHVNTFFRFSQTFFVNHFFTPAG